tara:strand:+ start:1750 stop:1971 length:222 start_codon:yes stop_codon:yes gene_type:complete
VQSHAELLEAVSIAKDQLAIGLKGMSRAELQQQYSSLVNLQVEYYRHFILPYFDAIKEIDENEKMLSVPTEDS